MATAYDVANYLIYLLSDCCDDLTNMKLNKLLYYAQGHYLQKTGHPLFSDTIEAWDHGPMVNSVYQKYKSHEKTPIKKWDQSLVQNISDDDQVFIMDIAREYSRYTASALREMTHKPNSPWYKCYTPGGYHTEIPISLIQEYFNTKVSEIKSVEPDIDEDSFIGYRDSEGYLVLPKDWDDEAV